MFSRVRDAAFFVRSVGVGDPPLVTTLALSVGSELWCDVTDRFAASRRVVAIDQRGAGRTQGSTAGMTLQTQTDDLVAVVADLGIGQCVHVTESAGCAPALAAAAREPERFVGLVLCAPGDWWLDPPDQREEMPSDVPVPEPAERQEILERMVTRSMVDTDDPVLLRWARALIPDDWERLMTANRVSLTNDLRAVVGEVSTPTLVVHGDADQVSAVDGSRRLVSALPDAELLVLEGVGHAPMVTAPDGVAAAISGFLKRLGV